MTMKKWIAALTGCTLSLSAIAGGTMDKPTSEEYRPWSVIGSLGYTGYKNFYHGDASAQAAIGDGKTAVGRFAIARNLGAFKTLGYGVEIGIQSGNIARLDIPQSTIDELGGLLPQVTIKPMLDLLATFSWQPTEDSPLSGLIKPGIAYRRLQVNDRTTFNDLAEVAFELQAGLGMRISDRASLSLNYQGIFARNTTYSINTTNFTGHIAHIQKQNGLLLGLAYSV